MNKVVLISLSLALTVSITLVLYLIPYFSKKKIKQGKFDLFQFILLFFAPVLITPMFYFLREIIKSNPTKTVIFIPKTISELTFLILLYLMIIGLGIHAVSVVLSKHMKNLRKHRVWEINEFFHNAFSHILITLSAILILSSFAVLEINRPNNLILSNIEIIILILSGLVSGIVLGIASIEGSIAKQSVILLYFLSLAFPFFFINYNLNFKYFPFTTFLESMFMFGALTIIFYGKKKKGFPEIVPNYFFED